MECERPNRSDIHLTTDEEEKIAEQTKEYFDGLAPKRHTKPQRSEYESRYVDADQGDTAPIPELVALQRLENDDHQKLVYSGTEVTEEFVETDYYKDLNCIDKQHHTTGTGFIEVENKGECYHIEPDSDTTHHPHTHGNPATNDWVPAPAFEI
ncbi:hypothetical protein AKJ16_DCAP22355 [Drosera capensis]